MNGKRVFLILTAAYRYWIIKINFNSYKVLKKSNQNIKPTYFSEVFYHSCFIVVFDLLVTVLGELLRVR